MAESRVNINKLDGVTSLKAGDFLIIETPEGTKILDFKDFSIGVGNTTFSATISSHTSDISDNTSLISQLTASQDINTNLVSQVSGVSGLMWRDDWSAATAYNSQDVVQYEQSSFVSIGESTNEAPADGDGVLNSSYWNYIAKKGSVTLPLSTNSAILSYYGGNLIEVKPESDDEIGYVLTSQGTSNTPVWQLGTDGQAGAKVERVYSGSIGSRRWGHQFGPVLLMTDGRLLVAGDDDGHGVLAQGRAHVSAYTFGLQPMMFDTRTWSHSADTVKNVTRGGRTNFVVSSAGDVYSTGVGEFGEHGHGDTTSRYMLTRIGYFKTNDIKINKVLISCTVDSTAGAQTSMFLTTAGDVYACGYNTKGNCGLGNTTSPQTTPVKVTNIGVGTTDGPIVEIYHGGTYSTTYAVTTGGKVYGWGYNGGARLGLGDTTDRTAPTVLTALSGAIKIEVPSNGIYYNDAGSQTYEQTFALLSTGVVYGAGTDPNSYGIFGVGAAGTRNTWTAVSGVSGFTDIAHSGAYNQAMVGLSGTEAYGWGYNGTKALDGLTTAAVLTPMKLSNVTGCLSSGPDQDNFDIRGDISEIAFHSPAGYNASYAPQILTVRDSAGNFYSAGVNTVTAGINNVAKNIPAPQLTTTVTTDGFVKWNLPCTLADIKDWGYYDASAGDTTDHNCGSYYILTTAGRLFVWGQAYGIGPMTTQWEQGNFSYAGVWREVRF